MSTLKKLKSIDAIIWFVIAFFIFSLVVVPGFANLNTLSRFMSQSSVLIIMACGVHMVVLNGGVDFTSTALLALTTVVGASIMRTAGPLGGSGFSIVLALLAMIGLGLLLGIINGLSITTFKMPSFIVTMATQMIVNGIAVVFTGGASVSGLPAAFGKFKGGIGIFPFILFIALGVAIVLHIITTKTIFGRQLYAVGTNHKTALTSGISPRKTIFKAYVISGICAGIAGIVELAYMQSGSVNYGSTMFNDIMASIIVGGTSPAGGSGKIRNTVLGALLISMIDNSLNILGVPYYYITLIKGLIILVAASIDLIRIQKRDSK